jgi:hypothetical protein
VNHRPEDQDQVRSEAEPDHPDPAAETDRPGTGRDDLPAGRDRLAAVLGLAPHGSGAGSGTTGAGAPGTGDPDDSDAPQIALEGLGTDEQALRRMLHESVGDIEPREGSLDYLRRAVPARRARKRQAVVGMAAAALFIGTAIPALVHVSNATGSDADPSIAGHAAQAQGGTGKGKDSDSRAGDSAHSRAKDKDKDEDRDEDKGKDRPKDKEHKGRGTSGDGTGGADPTAAAQSAPACTAAQLGGATANAGAPDSTGAVYGTFRTINVSAVSCTVSGAGSVFTVVQGAADPAKVSVLSHVAGDAAAALPEPSQDVTSLVLTPGSAYEVKFAWVPAETCPTTGGDGGGTGGTGGTGGDAGGPSPEPSPTSSGGESDDTTPQTGDVVPQLVAMDGVTDGSVVVSHTPATGAGTASATIPNACAGTVYHTGILTAP